MTKPLSERLRPNVEAAPWVIAAIIEQELVITGLHQQLVAFNHNRKAAYQRHKEVRTKLVQQLANSQKQVTRLRGLVEQSRGSVKFDLNRYEQLLTIKRMVGVEKTAQYIAVGIEANRLSNTLEGIDEALAATADLDGLILCHAEPIGWRLENDGVEYGITSYNREQADEYVAAGWNLKETIYRAWEPK